MDATGRDRQPAPVVERFDEQSVPPSDQDVSVSVVICTRNRCAVLDRCLATVARVDGIARADVLVVDNGSTDGTPAVADRWATTLPMLRSVFEPRTGLSHARNTALDHARGDVVAFLDDDVLVEAGWLDGILAAYRRWPDVAGVAGRIELAWPEGRPSWLPASREVWFARLDLGLEPRLLAASELPVGANMSVRRDVALSVGRFDPDLGYSGTRLLGNEERDFFDRLRRLGKPLGYEPAARVLHVVEGARVSRRYLLRRVYSQGRSDVRVDTETRRRTRPAQLRVAGRALSRAVLRNWRGDVRRLARRGTRGIELVDVLTGRAKQLGIAREAAGVAVGSGRRRRH